MNEVCGRILLVWMALGVVILPIVAVKIEMLKSGLSPREALWKLYIKDNLALVREGFDELPPRIATVLGAVVTVLAAVVCHILWLFVALYLVYDYYHPDEHPEKEGS